MPGELVLIVTSEYLMQAAGALADSGHRLWLTTAKILDNESKISPLLSPLGTWPGS